MTTITSTFKVDCLLDIQDLKQQMKETPLKIKKKGSAKPAYTWSVKDNKFFNQITVEYVDEFSKKSIKLFPNGSIHVTGCSDLVDCHRVMKQVKFCIYKFTKKTVKVFDFKILMINANFSMNSMLNLNMVSSLSENSGCIVSFKPEIYSAVKIKFVPGPGMKRITASVFSSGCVLITGAQNLKEITSSYNFMINILRTACIKPHTDLKKFDSFVAISFDSWSKHLLATN
jgi:TATA-box binding protein (TBP) (component of TFIID and TFIIIB)